MRTGLGLPLDPERFGLIRMGRQEFAVPRAFWFSALIFVGLVGASPLLIVGCGPSGGGHPSVRQQVDSDLTAIATTDLPGAADVDARYNGAFTKVFGGHRGADVRRYLDERVQHFSTPDEVNSIRVEPAFSSFVGNSATLPKKIPAQKGVIGANTGFLLWLGGHLEGHVTTVRVAGRSIVLGSSRPGFVQIAENYKHLFSTPSALGLALPLALRASVLLHEARHSDCPGGLDPQVLSEMRAARSERAFNEAWRGGGREAASNRCGQLHSNCAAIEGMRDVAQCENNPWGPATIELVYLMAVLPSAQGIDKGAIEAQIADRIARISGASRRLSVERVLRGEYGPPDMEAPPSAPPGGATTSGRRWSPAAATGAELGLGLGPAAGQEGV